MKEQQIDYKKKYFELYQNVAKLLVKNRDAKEPLDPYQLLIEWDRIRD